MLSPYAQAPKSRGIYRAIDSGNTLTTDGIVQRIIANRELYEKRNKAKEAKELHVIEAERKRKEEKKREEIMTK